MNLTNEEKAILSAKWICGNTSILAGEIQILFSALSESVSKRSRKNPNLYRAQRIMSQVIVDHLAILIVRMMDENKRTFSIPTYCKVLKAPGMRNVILKQSEQIYKNNEKKVNKDKIKTYIDFIQRKKDDIKNSGSYKNIKNHRNKTASHSTADAYTLDINDFPNVYLNILAVAEMLQYIYLDKVYNDKYKDVEDLYRDAGAKLWSMRKPIESVIRRSKIVLIPGS